MKELQDLYQTIKMGAATVADKQRFVELIAMPANEKIAKELLNDYVLYAETMETIKLPGDDRLKMIGESIVAQEPTAPYAPGVRMAHRVHFLKTAWFRYAAVLILAVGIVTYYFTRTASDENTSDNTIVKVDIAPGSERAILILSNGDQVPLNNSTSETIVDGKVSIKNNNGELLYQAGTAGTTNTMATPKGGQYKLTLSDGTKVWLNAASSITYPTSFSGPNREVNITGEVYLEVTKNSNKPFRVKVKNIGEVDVLGTSFNINAYGDDALMSTTLLEGSVKIKDNKQSVLISPGEQANILSEKTKKIVIKKADTEKVMAWKNGLFNFEGAELTTIMQQLARWYDVEIIYEGDIPKRYFQGKMDRGLTLAQVVKILEETGVNFTIEKGKLTVSK